ncbi:hypothetical protein MCHI_003611 [Candidatus Magnetoovum chiemensis]|nr:hypothetical protein MCHI_003611 [Candidatus Magnetoovum chiemensis]
MRKKDHQSANKAKDRLTMALSYSKSREDDVKITCKDKDGVIKKWRISDGFCPKCNALCTVKVPQTPNTPHIVKCRICGYEEGIE